MDRRKRYRQTVALMSMLSETKTIDNVDIATFDGNGADLLSIIVGIDPLQDLHGYDSPWPAGGGVSKCPMFADGTHTLSNGITFTIKDGEITINGTPNGAGYWQEAITPTVMPENPYVSLNNPVGTYNASLGFIVDASEIGPSLAPANKTTALTGLGGKTVTHIRLYFNGQGSFDNFKLSPIVHDGDTPQTWTPYSNICPISGWTECNISHSGADTSDPTIYNIAFPSEAGTVYGGTLDVVRKKLTVNRENIPSYNGETLSGEWISDRDVYSVGGTPTIGAQVVYALASPVVYDLTNVPTIQTFAGENNIWADTGKIIFLEYEA